MAMFRQLTKELMTKNGYGRLPTREGMKETF